MHKTVKTATSKRILTTVALATLWLAGAGGGFAADAPATPAKRPAAPPAAADETVVLDDTMMWRIYRVEGRQHVRATDGKLISCGLRAWATANAHYAGGEGGILSDIGIDQLGGKIEITLAIGIPEVGALGPVHGDRVLDLALIGP